MPMRPPPPPPDKPVDNPAGAPPSAETVASPSIDGASISTLPPLPPPPAAEYHTEP